jgi:hypothetical protein
VIPVGGDMGAVTSSGDHPVRSPQAQKVTPAKESVADRLRAVGATAWSVVGLALVAIGAVLLLMLLRPLVLALVVAVLVAIACAPLVDVMTRHRLPRVAGAAGRIH